MVKPRFLILRVAGTNCDQETQWALEMVGAKTERVHLNEFITRRKNLSDYDGLVLPGGFSYGDDIAAGKVLANQLTYRLRDDLLAFVDQRKPVIGICNGFQALVKSAFLPGGSTLQQATLAWNDSGRFEDRWVYLKVEPSICPFTRGLPEMIRLPVAHAEGKFMVKHKKLLESLERRRQIAFRYVTPAGEIGGYPYNPNGSVAGIAGICNPTGTVLGMMPHPERAVLREHYPDWLREEELVNDWNPAGWLIFRNVVNYVS
ncbi:MAG: phosphoribosylformylglycinamidine synthase I [Candidatus Omnitrophica bacterium]|nr:phosphoribosylformylglycinamidine synthase I [Candidatus Omnitrophota bacterium]